MSSLCTCSRLFWAEKTQNQLENFETACRLGFSRETEPEGRRDQNPQDKLASWKLKQETCLGEHFFYSGKTCVFSLKPFNWLDEAHPHYGGWSLLEPTGCKCYPHPQDILIATSRPVLTQTPGDRSPHRMTQKANLHPGFPSTSGWKWNCWGRVCLWAKEGIIWSSLSGSVSRLKFNQNCTISVSSNGSLNKMGELKRLLAPSLHPN